MREEIGKNIKSIRRQKGISQQELADKIEMNRSTVAYWEMGKTTISLDMVTKLAEALDISLFDLFNYNSVDIENEVNDDLTYLNKLLCKNNIISSNYKLSNRDYEKIINFLKVNINFIIDKDNNK